MPNDPDAAETPQLVRFVCANAHCGKVQYLRPGSIHAGRRYCNLKCYEERTNISAGAIIVRAMGGKPFLADYFHLDLKYVTRWRYLGIPRKYHHAMLVLAKQRGVADRVTMDLLRESLEHTRLRKLGLVGRRASTMPPSPATLYRRRKREALTAAATGAADGTKRKT